MLRSTVPRIRLAISAFGCVVLGASLFNWAHTLRAGGQPYAWVGANASNAAAIERAEVWQVSARCARPYFARAVLRSKAKLKAYYDLAPPEVRARLDRSAGLPLSTETSGWYHLAKAEPKRRQRNDADLEYVAQLHVQYAEWFANVFKLEIAASQWEQRLTDVADQRLVFSESARKSFDAGQNTKAADSADGFDDHVLATLGLGGFPSEEEQALKSECIKVDLIKKISTAPNYFGELWRWPLEETAAFALGLELVLIGLFLVPITLWIGTGDPQVAAQHLRDVTCRLTARVRGFRHNQFIARAMANLQAVSLRMRAGLIDLSAQLGSRLGPAVNRQVQSLRSIMAASLHAAMKPTLQEQSGAGESGFAPPPRPFPRRRQQWRSRCTRMAAVRR